MLLSEHLNKKDLKDQITTIVLERFKAQKQNEVTKPLTVRNSFCFDVPFFTAQIKAGEPQLDFLELTENASSGTFNHSLPTTSLAQFFKFYQTLLIAEQESNESTQIEFNTKFILDFIERNAFCKKFIEHLGITIAPKQLEKSGLNFIFPVLISKDLSVSGWFSFSISIQENAYLDLDCVFIEVSNIANLFTADNAIAKHWHFDSINEALIEDLIKIFKANRVSKCLQTELPVFTDKRFGNLFAKTKEGLARGVDGIFASTIGEHTHLV